ncbi:hypothetical protein B0H34DRAFT_126251 [Crassisporium funariophilum]|nr:hypothetical protein B0H34DRAFT_126251 [Crassisporium funariophilum]
MSSTSWRPDVPASQLFEEKTWLQGGILSAVAYGVVVTLFFLNFVLLKDRIRAESSSVRRKQNTALLGYISVMFLLSTLTMASQAEYTQLGFIDNRDFPGGPAAYQKLMFSIPISNLGNVCFSLMNWLADVVLLWRCTVIYRAANVSLVMVMACPTAMLLASFITGVIYLEEISRPGSSPWESELLTLIYGLISFSLNIVLTLMIVIRLYLHRRRVVKAIGSRHASQYTSIMSMLIESAFVLDIVFLAFIIPFAFGNPIANIPLLTLVQVQTIASFMIIFRVATGTAWASGTIHEILTQEIAERLNELSVMRFDHSGMDTRTAVDTHHHDAPHSQRKSDSTSKHPQIGTSSIPHAHAV